MLRLSIVVCMCVFVCGASDARCVGGDRSWGQPDEAV